MINGAKLRKLLIVVDMQNDFISGTLGSPQAEAILPNVKAKIEEYRQNGYQVIFTRDTHTGDYLTTQEGEYLPVIHCVKGTDGHLISGELDLRDDVVFDKGTFGSLELAKRFSADDFDEIELCGLCTEICVVSNALILKAQLPETRITVDAACCAGVTVEGHKAALLTMKNCQVMIHNWAS